MATQGPKSGRCGGGQAGVLRCRVAGLAPSPLDRGSQEDNPALGDRCNPSGVQQRGPDPSGCLHPQAGGGLGEESKHRFPIKSASWAHGVAGQKLNFNPVCAASQRIPQPGHRGGYGGRDRGWRGRGNCGWPLPGSPGRWGQIRPLPPSEPGITGLSCSDDAPPAGHRAALWPRATPAAAAPPPCALAPLPRVRLARPRAAAWAPAAGPTIAPGAGTNFLLPGSPSRAFQVSGCRRPPGHGAASFLRPLRSPEPRAPGGRPASAPTKPAAPGDPARGWEGPEGRRGPRGRGRHP